MRDRNGDLNTAHLIGDIGRRATRGGTVMLGAQVVKLVAQFGSVIVLARVLAPAEFGLIAMVGAMTALFEIVKELGLSAATMQKTDITHEQVSALFWINTGAGCLIAACLALGAPVIARFYGQPDLEAVTRWLALGFVMSGATVQHWALLRRQMRFSAIAIAETGSELMAFVVAVVLAFQGWGHWALVAQRLAAPLLVMTGCWILCRWRPSLPRRTPGIPELLGFGLSVSGCGILATLARSVDQILVGRLFGAATLGLYERAARLVLVPMNSINAPLYSVAMPALSRLVDEPQRFRRAFGVLIERVAMVTMPAAAGAAVASDWVTNLLFGPKWEAMSPLITCFALVAAVQPTLMTAGLIYLPQGRSRDLLRSTAIDVALAIASFVAGIPYGAVGVAGAYAAIGLVIRLPVCFYLAAGQGPVTQRDLYLRITPSVVASLAVAAVVWILRNGVMPESLLAAPLVALAVAAVVGMLTAGVAFLLMRPSRDAMTGVVRSLFSRHPPQPVSTTFAEEVAE
ncbi:PST family polysaccharide transporter [Nitrospirillum amazonense]|uniref:PST family polysaccharide transporter n=1 Tax=Nitrospirillum amazonense TaxID=28077 RepID=A0A560K2X8_9PROT|nr:lipopolysaccharide biosynthesis protein [Nitrospirillum amazonense]TWB77693.1 PST family polysaccharide transporter [Nitrospirillum amazonense]